MAQFRSAHQAYGPVLNYVESFHQLLTHSLATFSPISETFRNHFDTILVRRTLKCLIMVVLFRALENESRYSILIAINYYAIYFDCILNCINCSKRSWKNSWRSSVQELFECFYFCSNKMVIFGPFGTIEPLCTSSNQNNTKMVLFNWTNYFILSLIDFLKSRFGPRKGHFSDHLLVFEIMTQVVKVT